MHNQRVQQLVADDTWTLAEGEADTGPYILRFRQPVLKDPETSGYDRCLRIVWIYADENSGALPDDGDSSAMASFEDRVCEALELDLLGALVAVLTFDGARQWVFYTFDVAECGKRINQMPQDENRYPIELDAFIDPEWSYLRTEILARVDGGA